MLFSFIILNVLYLIVYILYDFCNTRLLSDSQKISIEYSFSRVRKVIPFKEPSVSIQEPIIYIQDPIISKDFAEKWKRHKRDVRKVYKWRIFSKDLNVPSSLIRPVEEIPILALCITTDSLGNGKVKNTLALMSLYQRLYSFRGFVFTEADDVVKACKEYNLTVFSTIQRNAYNLPFVSHIMNYLVEHVNASYYGYMNSDILFHPDVFKIIPVIHDKIQRSILPNNIGLISCVRNVKYRFSVKDFSSYKSLQKVFHRGKEGKMRNPFSIDLFIYPSSFPFSHIPPVVVGRACVDSVLFQVPEYDGGFNIDITPYAVNIHQGSDNYLTHGYYRQDIKDRSYNNRFLFNPISRMEYSRFVIRKDNHLWEVKK